MMFFNKANLLLLVSLAAILPLGLGGREPLMAITLFLLMLLGVFIVWRLPDAKPLAMDWLVVGWLGLLGWSVMSLVWSINRFQTTVWILELVTATAAFIVAYHLQDRRRAWLSGYWFVTIGFSLYGFWVYATDSYERLTSTFYWANPFAAFFTPAVLLALWYWGKERSRIAFAAGTVGLSAITLTYSRSVYVVLAVIAVIFAIKYRREGRAFWTRVALMLVATMILMQAVNFARVKVQQIQSNSKSKILTASSRFAEAAKGESISVQDRWLYLVATGQIVRDFPVLGTGGGTFRTSFVRYQPRVITYSLHAHNLYAQIASELGIPGIVFVLALLWGALQVAWRSLKDPKNWPWAMAMLVAVIHLGLDFDSSYPVFWPLIGALVGLVYSNKSNRSKKQKTPSVKYPIWVLIGMLLLAWPVLSRYTSRQHADWGQFRQELGSYARAADSYRQAHTGVVYDPDTLLSEGINYFLLAVTGQDKDKNLRQAEELAITTQNQDPWDPQPVLLQARVQNVKGDLVKAEASYLRLIKMAPFDNPDYYHDLAFLYFGQGRIDECVAISTRAINNYPDSVLANRHNDKSIAPKVSNLHRVRAQAYVAQGKVDLAKADLERSIKLNPANQASQDLLNRLKAL